MKLVVQFKSLTDLLHQLQDLNEGDKELATVSSTEERPSEIPLPLLNVAPELVRLLAHPEIDRLMRVAPDEDAETDVMLPYILFESVEGAPN